MQCIEDPKLKSFQFSVLQVFLLVQSRVKWHNARTSCRRQPCIQPVLAGSFLPFHKKQSPQLCDSRSCRAWSLALPTSHSSKREGGDTPLLSVSHSCKVAWARGGRGLPYPTQRPCAAPVPLTRVKKVHRGNSLPLPPGFTVHTKGFLYLLLISRPWLH